MPIRTQRPASVAPPDATTVQFASTARALAAAARRFGLAAPSFRTPPRLADHDRTLRRHASGGVVAVRLGGRPWAAVVADMIDGVMALNQLDARRAARVRADLWHVVTSGVDAVESAPSAPSTVTVLRPPPRRIAC
jgi:hypothetical protein